MALRFLRVLLTAGVAATVARADIAPTQYVGGGLVPVDAPGMRMVSAKVDIVWGSPCSLSATFVIENKGAQPRVIDLGFPVTQRSFEGQMAQVPSDLLFAFNGKPLPDSSIAIDDPVTRKLRSLYLPSDIDADNLNINAALLFLEQKSKDLDPEHVGIRFVLSAPQDDPSCKIDFNYGKGGNLLEVLDMALYLAHLQYSVGDSTVYVHPAVKGGHNPDDFTWYRCRHTFPPGRTSVSIKTELPATLDYNFPYREHLFYCIETGGAWDGTIGSEQVDIHFPGPVAPGQILLADPGDYTVEGNIVRWQFTDFKPKGEDHDVELKYLRPDVVSVLARLQAKLAQDPANPSLVLKLARNLFALGPYKGYAPYPPDNVSPTDFQALLAKIKNDGDRARFKSFYSLNAKGTYEESDDQWNADGDETLRILNDIDYAPPFDRSSYVDEARAQVEKLIANQPTNADAWNTYFANYYRFHFAGGRYQIGNPTYYPQEVAQIQKAVTLCPGDVCLKLWLKLATGPPHQDYYAPDVKALFDQLKKQGISNNDYLKIRYDDH